MNEKDILNQKYRRSDGTYGDITPEEVLTDAPKLDASERRRIYCLYCAPLEPTLWGRLAVISPQTGRMFVGGEKEYLPQFITDVRRIHGFTGQDACIFRVGQAGEKLPEL